MSSVEPLHILVCDDDAVFRQRLVRAFRDRNLETSEAAHYDEALTIAARERITHSVLDLRMPGKSGLELLATLVMMIPGLKVVLLTGYGSIATTVQALKLGALNYLTKPTDADSVLRALGLERACIQVSPSPAKMRKEIPGLEQVEWDHIQRVVHDCQGNISKAAKLLGLHRRSLQRKLQKPPQKLR